MKHVLFPLLLILSPNAYSAEIIDIFGDSSSGVTGFGEGVDASHDMNSDGVNDFVYPYINGSSTEIRIRSGSDGSMLATLPIDEGYNSIDIGDMNGDGYPDIAIGVPSHDSISYYDIGLVYVISGSDYSILFEEEGTEEWGDFGQIVAFNDFNNDGQSELVVLSGSYDVPVHVEVFNSNGSSRCVGDLPPDFLDRDIVSLIGGVNPNQDNTIDFALGAPVYGTDGALLFFNGSTCSFITAMIGGPGTSQFGAQILPAGDFDGDLVNDIAVYSDSAVFILKGKGLGSISSAPSGLYSLSLPVGDLNGDGVPDFILEVGESSFDRKLQILSGANSSVIGVIDNEKLQKALEVALGGNVNASIVSSHPIFTGHKFNLNGDSVSDFAFFIDSVILNNSYIDFIVSFSGQCLRQVILDILPSNGMIVKEGNNLFTATPEVCGVKLNSNLTVSGAGQNLPMKDDGTSGDITPNDDTYSAVLAVPNGTTSFSIQGTVGNFSSFEAFNVSTATPYQFRSSTYEWIDGGIDINGASQIVERNLPFSFKFYGKDRTKLFISPKGLAGFTEGSTDSDNEPLPSKKLKHDYLVPLWADLVPTSASRVLVNTVGSSGGRRFIISWENFEFKPTVQNEVSQVTFQVVLSEGSNLIKYNFKRVYSSLPTKDKGASAISGIQASALFATMFSNREQKLTDLSSVEFFIDSNGGGNNNGGGNSGGGSTLSTPEKITTKFNKKSRTLTASLPLKDGAQYVFEFKVRKAGKKTPKKFKRKTTSKPKHAIKRLQIGDYVIIKGAYSNEAGISGFTKEKKVRIRN